MGVWVVWRRKGGRGEEKPLRNGPSVGLGHVAKGRYGTLGSHEDGMKCPKARIRRGSLDLWPSLVWPG